MTQKEIITDRINLMADILQHAPQVNILDCLTQQQSDDLLALLNVLTDRAEVIFTGMSEQEEQQMEEQGPSYGVHKVIDDGIICGDCDLHCEIHWDKDGNISGARCSCGITAANASRVQLGIGGE